MKQKSKKFSELFAEVDNALEQIYLSHEDDDEPWDGVLSDEEEKKLSSIEGEIYDKQEATVAFAKRLKEDIDILKAEKKAIDERKRVKENKYNNVISFLSHITGGNKFECASGVFSGRKSTKVVLAPDVEEAVKLGNVPSQLAKWSKTIVTYSVNKAELKKALKDADVEGAQLVESINYSVK